MAIYLIISPPFAILNSRSAMKCLVLLTAVVLAGLVEVQAVDLTVTPKEKGSDVVEAVVDLIQQ
jgi:hypothetical protein